MNRPKKIRIDSAWTGTAMTETPDLWTYRLSKTQIAEMEGGTGRFLESGIELGTMTRDRFPLPTVAPLLHDLREALQHGIGFGLVRGVRVDGLSTSFLATMFFGIGSYLGSARSQNAMGHLLGHVTDIGADRNSSSTRIYQTSARQTFHTDSSDAVGLMCLTEAMEGGDSLLVSTATIYNRMMERRPDLVELLFQPVATDRRGEVPKGEKPYFMIPVLNWYEGYLTGMYQRQYIESTARFPDAPKPDESFFEALDLFDEIANDPDIHLRMRLKPGDMQFVYNHATLHDRTEYRDWSEPNKRRHLLRLWLSLPEDRPLPPTFAERYGSVTIGDRGGIIVPNAELCVPLSPWERQASRPR